MAKQSGIINLRGKVGDTVYTQGRHGSSARSAPQLTDKQRKEKALLPQNRRTAVLNTLASSVRHAVKYYAGALMPGSFYADVQSAFRTEPTDHRTLLLDRIKHMDVHPRYPFVRRCPLPVVKTIVSKTTYTVEADINHPAYDHNDEESFYLQFIFMVWNKDDHTCRHMHEHTEWMSVKDSAPKYVTLKYKRTAMDTDYLLACRCVTGRQEISDATFTSTSMCFLGGGSVTKEGLQLLEERRAARESAEKAVPVKKEIKEKKRVAVRTVK